MGCKVHWTWSEVSNSICSIPLRYPCQYCHFLALVATFFTKMSGVPLSCLLGYGG